MAQKERIKKMNNVLEDSSKISVNNKTVKKSTGLKLDGTPNASWLKFQDRLNNYFKMPIKEWGTEQFLGHIFKRYEDHYKVSHKLSYTGTPKRCQEMYCTNKMVLELCPKTLDPEMVKSFIDYVFDSIIIPQKKNITSLGLFFTVKIIKDFKDKYKKMKVITRSTELPTKILGMVQDAGLEDSIITYGDLAFAKKATDENKNNDSYKTYYELFEMLEDAGFNFETLNSIEG